MNIVLLGGPGAGKGTLARQLYREYGYYAITPGELYRKEAKLGTEFGLRAQKYWADGNLCPDEMTNELVKNTIKDLDGLDLLFDGYPRTVVQAEYLDSICKIDFVIDLIVSDDVATERLLKRQAIENRSDDTEEIIRQRLEVYHKNNELIIKHYAGPGWGGHFEWWDNNPRHQRYSGFRAEGTIQESFRLAQSIILARKSGV